LANARSVCDTILIIEDDDAIRDAIQYALEAEGYHVVTAADGKSGLETLGKIATPCLILLDLMLPIMNGWEFLDEVKKDPGNMVAAIPVVITSAAGSSAQSAAKRAQGYIKKPIDLRLLLATVDKYCSAAKSEGSGSTQVA
jgi:CheY-like chemotaxis protein